ncbi:MAG: PEP-CTERM sorting domain-containing protein [Acidobacteriota bacterium]
MRSVSLVAMLLMAAVVAAPRAGAAILQDPGFELSVDGTLTSNSAWVLTSNIPDGLSLAAQFSDLNIPGKGGLMMVWFKSFEGMFDPGDPAAQAELMQMVNATPGVYDLTFRAKLEAHFTAGQAFVEISSDVGDLQAFDLFSIPTGIFGDFAINNFIASAGTTKLTIRAVMVDGVFADMNPQSLLLDDFNLTGGGEVPEPGTMALLGSGLVCLWFAKRRRG